MINNKFILMFFTLFVGLSSCTKDTMESDNNSGKLVMKFVHYVNGRPLQRDTLIYMNAAFNHYLITDLKYFISEVTLYNSDGTRKLINEQQEIHYIDEDLPDTKIWNVSDKIVAGTYDSISFIFGITAEKNKSHLFVNPPEVNMMWPDILGGGYHYMMMDGYWEDRNFEMQPFDFHLGIGQIYSGNTTNTDSIIGYIQNYFTVNLPKSSFTIKEGETREIEIRMNIDSWFKTPHIYDFNYWGGSIMQNQAAMRTAVENSWDVFTINHIN